MFNLFSLLAKFFRYFFKLFKLGEGTTIVSNLYLKIFSKKISFSNYKFSKGVIFITGTNGKSSTTKLLSDFLTYLGYKVLYNETGGNILRSILGLFLIKNGVVKNNEYDFLVLEVDEASLLEISKFFSIDVLVLLNFSRDQLDRYFELENISSNILELLKKNPHINLVFNKEDSYCLQIASEVLNKKVSFSKNFDILKISNIKEEYMAYNIDAVVKILSGYGYYPKDFLTPLRTIKKPFGRGEEILYKGICFRLHLAKNPNSFNNNLIELQKKKIVTNLLFCLNDETPDGKDISWIYDIEPYLIYEVANEKNLYFTGHRAFEMANRVNMAIDASKKTIVEISPKEIIKSIIKSKITEVEVLCNYSAMLKLRKILLGKNIL
jgi:UDP-N-acetylmuramyl tripeptide synthase